MPLETEQVDAGYVRPFDAIASGPADREATPQSPPVIEPGRRDRET